MHPVGMAENKSNLCPWGAYILHASSSSLFPSTSVDIRQAQTSALLFLSNGFNDYLCEVRYQKCKSSAINV